MSATDELRTLAERMDGLVLETPDMLREAADEIDQLVMKLNAEHLVRQNMERENAKLRELVKDVMPIVCRGCYERLCEMPEGEHPFVTCSFADRMRELGVDA